MSHAAVHRVLQGQTIGGSGSPLGQTRNRHPRAHPAEPVPCRSTRHLGPCHLGYSDNPGRVASCGCTKLKAGTRPTTAVLSPRPYLRPATSCVRPCRMRAQPLSCLDPNQHYQPQLSSLPHTKSALVPYLVVVRVGGDGVERGRVLHHSACSGGGGGGRRGAAGAQCILARTYSCCSRQQIATSKLTHDVVVGVGVLPRPAQQHLGQGGRPPGSKRDCVSCLASGGRLARTTLDLLSSRYWYACGQIPTGTGGLTQNGQACTHF